MVSDINALNAQTSISVNLAKLLFLMNTIWSKWNLLKRSKSKKVKRNVIGRSGKEKENANEKIGMKIQRNKNGWKKDFKNLAIFGNHNKKKVNILNLLSDLHLIAHHLIMEEKEDIHIHLVLSEEFHHSWEIFKSSSNLKERKLKKRLKKKLKRRRKKLNLKMNLFQSPTSASSFQKTLVENHSLIKISFLRIRIRMEMN